MPHPARRPPPVPVDTGIIKPPTPPKADQQKPTGTLPGGQTVDPNPVVVDPNPVVVDPNPKGDQGGIVGPTTPRIYPAIDISDYILEPLDITDPTRAEYAPYADAEDGREGYCTKLTNWASSKWKQGVGTAKKMANYLKSEENFDILYSLPESPKDIRATKSNFCGKHQTSDLYRLSANRFKRYTWDAVKKSWNEGVLTGHSDQENAVKIAEATPGILAKKAQLIVDGYNDERKVLTRRAAAVLTDETYENKEYLIQLIGELQTLMGEYKDQMSLFSLRDNSNDTRMKEVHDGVAGLLEEHFGGVDHAREREVARVDELKADLSNRFQKLGEIAEEVSLVESLLASSTVVDPDADHEVYDLKEKVNNLMLAHFTLARAGIEKVDTFREDVERFEQGRVTVRV